MKTRILLALAATTALLTSIQVHAQSSSSFDAYGRPRATTEQLCAQARQMGGPVTERCAWLQWSGSSAPSQPYTAPPAQPAPAPQADPAAILEGYRLALSSVAANHGHDGSERVTYDFSKYGYAYRTKMPLWIAMLLDADQSKRDGYILDNQDNWRRIKPTGHLDFWQKW